MIMDDLNRFLPMFIKVIPYDYKKYFRNRSWKN